MAELNFDATTVKPNVGFEPIPNGRYNVVITDSDMKATSKGDGHYLKLTFKILDGEFVNRLVWKNLNLDNPNEKAVEIAQSDLSNICRACGLGVIADSQELHGIPMSGQVRIKPGSGGYGPSNDVNDFKEPIDSSAAATTEAAPWA